MTNQLKERKNVPVTMTPHPYPQTIYFALMVRENQMIAKYRTYVAGSVLQENVVSTVAQGSKIATRIVVPLYKRCEQNCEKVCYSCRLFCDVRSECGKCHERACVFCIAVHVCEGDNDEQRVLPVFFKKWSEPVLEFIDQYKITHSVVMGMFPSKIVRFGVYGGSWQRTSALEHIRSLIMEKDIITNVDAFFEGKTENKNADVIVWEIFEKDDFNPFSIVGSVRWIILDTYGIVTRHEILKNVNNQMYMHQYVFVGMKRHVTVWDVGYGECSPNHYPSLLTNVPHASILSDFCHLNQKFDSAICDFSFHDTGNIFLEIMDAGIPLVVNSGLARFAVEIRSGDLYWRTSHLLEGYLPYDKYVANDGKKFYYVAAYVGNHWNAGKAIESLSCLVETVSYPILIPMLPYRVAYCHKQEASALTTGGYRDEKIEPYSGIGNQNIYVKIATIVSGDIEGSRCVGKCRMFDNAKRDLHLHENLTSPLNNGQGRVFRWLTRSGKYDLLPYLPSSDYERHMIARIRFGGAQVFGKNRIPYSTSRGNYLYTNGLHEFSGEIPILGYTVSEQVWGQIDETIRAFDYSDSSTVYFQRDVRRYASNLSPVFNELKEKVKKYDGI